MIPLKRGGSGLEEGDLLRHVLCDAHEVEDGELLFSMYGEETIVKAEVQQAGKTNIHYKTLVELIRLYPKEALRFMPAHYLRAGTKTVIAMQADYDRSIFTSNMDAYAPFPCRPGLAKVA